jgi:hypothetical protein
MENMRFLYWDDYEEETPKKDDRETFSDSLEDE